MQKIAIYTIVFLNFCSSVSVHAMNTKPITRRDQALNMFDISTYTQEDQAYIKQSTRNFINTLKEIPIKGSIWSAGLLCGGIGGMFYHYPITSIIVSTIGIVGLGVFSYGIQRHNNQLHKLNSKSSDDINSTIRWAIHYKIQHVQDAFLSYTSGSLYVKDTITNIPKNWKNCYLTAGQVCWILRTDKPFPHHSFEL